MDTPTGLTWDGNKAKWSAVPGASYYLIRLYNDDSFLTSIFTTSTEYDLEMAMAWKHGEAPGYTFTIQAIPATSDTTHLDSDKSASSPTHTFVHTHASIHHAAVDATCAAEGNTEYWECYYCGKFYTDAAGTIETTADAVKIAKLPHSPSTDWTKDADNHWHTCSGCTELLDKAAHTFGKWTIIQEPTETTKGVGGRSCTVCGFQQTTVIPMSSHTHSFNGIWVYDETNHWQLCSCGEEGNVNAHTYGEWTVTTPATTQNTGTETRNCSVCGATETRAIPKLETTTAPTTKPTTEPTTKPSTEPTTKPVTEPTTKPVTEPTTKPVTEEPTTELTYMLGDVNGDGKVNASDARLALRISAGLETATETQLLAADVDESKKVTASDARKILRVSAELDIFK